MIMFLESFFTSVTSDPKIPARKSRPDLQLCPAGMSLKSCIALYNEIESYC